MPAHYLTVTHHLNWFNLDNFINLKERRKFSKALSIRTASLSHFHFPYSSKTLTHCMYFSKKKNYLAKKNPQKTPTPSQQNCALKGTKTCSNTCVYFSGNNIKHEQVKMYCCTRHDIGSPSITASPPIESFLLRTRRILKKCNLSWVLLHWHWRNNFSISFQWFALLLVCQYLSNIPSSETYIHTYGWEIRDYFKRLFKKYIYKLQDI